LISLDGGIGSAYGAGVVQRTPYYSLSRINVPLLHLHGPNVPGTDLTYLNSLKYSERYLVAFPGMRHGDFTNYGMLEHFVPGILGKPSGDTKTGFEWVCRYALHFLKAYLKKDGESLTFLKNPPGLNEVPAGLVTVERKNNLDAPPDARQLQAMIEQKGIESITALYRNLKRTDPQPLPQQTLSDVGRWLAEKNDWKSAREIVDLRLDSYPDSAWAHYAAADVYRRLGDNERARKLYGDALRLLAEDFDPEIDFNRRRAIYEGARSNLASANNR
jgi:tetratricopeptide (TPR) repeat protein